MRSGPVKKLPLSRGCLIDRIEEQASQCGYCQSGQIMWDAPLARNWSPTRRQQIVEDMKPTLCQCGTYLRIVRDLERSDHERHCQAPDVCRGVAQCESLI